MFRRRLLHTAIPTRVTEITPAVMSAHLRSLTHHNSSRDVDGGLTLTIGDVTVPVPASVKHPERVTWILPGSTTYNSNEVNHTNYHQSTNVENEQEEEDGILLQGGNAFFQLQDPTTRRYLRWICQKELLRQDMCLVGEPGPAMRWLVQMYSLLVRREVQCLALNRDTTESDLGQRREICNGTLVYDDQCVVIAASEGQLLLLEGLEKVERNVLPVINNLLENREMHLENGMMLIHPERYDQLLHELLPGVKRRRSEHDVTGSSQIEDRSVGDSLSLAVAHQEMRKMGFIRVSEQFRVIGLTVPVPPYDGNPLDPPLRSRFQCLYINIPLPCMTTMTGKTSLSATATGNTFTKAGAKRVSDRRSVEQLESLLKLRATLDEVNASTKEFNTGSKPSSSASGTAFVNHQSLQSIGSYELFLLSRQLQLFPDIPVGDVLPRGFPWMLYAQQTVTSGAAHMEEVNSRRREYERLLTACNINVPTFNYCQNESGSDENSKAKNKNIYNTTRGEDTASTQRSSSRLPKVSGRTDRILREQVTTLQTSRSSSGPSTETVVRSAEQFNDVVRVENIHMEQQSCNAVIVADACIASKGGMYALPLYMGEAAAHAITTIITTTAAAAEVSKQNGFVVTEQCPALNTVFTAAHYHVLQSMLQLHIAGQHILLLGPTGCGKTTILHEFAHLLGYITETMYLYADMTNKDLFQRRTTDSKTGDTMWKNSALVEAALSGHIAVLDGVDKVQPGMLSSLQQLLVDGSANLYDGAVLKSQREYEILKRKMHATDEVMREHRIFPVHPAFRVVATARPAGSSSESRNKAGQNSWRITREVTSLFGIVTMPAATKDTLHAVLTQVAAAERERCQNEDNTSVTTVAIASDLPDSLARDVERLLQLRDALERLQATEPKIPQLSLRQLLHLIRFCVRYPDDFTPGVESALLLPLLASLTAEQVRQAMRSCGFDDVRSHDDREEQQQQQQQQGRQRNPEMSVTIEAALQEGRRSKRHDVLKELLPVSVVSISLPGDSGNDSATGGEGRRRRRRRGTDNDHNNGPVTRVFAVHERPVLRIRREYTEKELALVPYIPYFHSNPVHESIIAWLAKQYAVGNNILLIGNQGVGKNKVVDAFLARIRVPREYIQLHRDTTVGSLTINPTVEGGHVVWTDSPLVRAVRYGHCLVVDEIDKAPVEVVQVLKGLVEDHEMRLRDGRQIRGPKSRVLSAAKNKNNNRSKGNNNTDDDKKDVWGNDGGDNIIAMHPDFRIIVLANPPGFPFHGNDFYRECGDLFAPYVMGNPDALSQLRVLKAYAPDLPDPLLVRLISAFQGLQKNFEEGHLTYPFSLRELIAVVRHLAAFPHDGIYSALNNVFNFDARNENTLHLVRQILHLHLQSLVNAGGIRRLMPLRAGQALPLYSTPELLRVPAIEAEPRSSLLSSNDLGKNGIMSLPIRFLTQEESDGVYSALPAHTWSEQYREAEFAANVLNNGSEGFTEWLSSPSLPFLHTEDTVLGVAATDVDNDTGMLTGVAVLFSRPAKDDDDKKNSKSKNEKNKRSLVLALTTLPSVSSFGITKDRRLNLPPGHVLFFDLTDILPAVFGTVSTLPSLSLQPFNAASHAVSPNSTLGNWLFDVFGAPAPLMAVIDATSGLMLLVNTSAHPAHPYYSLTASHQSQLQQQEKEECNSVRPVLLVRVTPSCGESSSSSSLYPFAVRPENGIIAMTQPHSSELFLWMNGHHIAVKLPATSIEKVHFFTDNLLAVRLRSAEVTIHAVMKVAVMSDGTAAASLCVMPKSIPGTVVGLREKKNTGTTASSGEASETSNDTLLQTLTPEELQGAVIVPENDKNSAGDVVYMMVDGYSQQEQSWSLRVFTDSEVACALHSKSLHGGTLEVYHTHHQLLGSGHSKMGRRGGVVAVDFQQHTARYFASPPATAAEVTTTSSSSLSQSTGPLFTVDENTGVALLYDGAQRLLVADVVAERVESRYRSWSTMLDGSVKQVGAPTTEAETQPLPMSYSKPRKQPSGTLKHGKEDDEEHHGGNTYAGGTGGTDTAGLGGLVGPYRLDKGRPVHQVSPEAKKQVPPHIIEEAKRMGREALQQRLDEIGMTTREYEHYRGFQERVRAPVALLRSILSGLKAAEGERTWLRGQTDGVWDDSKIIEGIVGERNIYKRRGDSTETSPFNSKHKKRLLFVLDVSASMYRFESMDHRLTKLLESTVMVMEAFAGFEDKIDYAMVGHNGDSACIELIPFGQQPGNQKARMEVCQRMIAHAQYCWSGDNTVEAMRRSIHLVTAEKGDAYLVFVISDANLPRYGIEPRELSTIMRSHKDVQMFCVFIATLGEQASNMQAEMPHGHGFLCMDTQALPHILKRIFMSVNLL